MTIRNIITEPDKILRKISSPVQKVGDTERKIMDDMIETMYLSLIHISEPTRLKLEILREK